jgi:hypothetical protein
MLWPKIVPQRTPIASSPSRGKRVVTRAKNSKETQKGVGSVSQRNLADYSAGLAIPEQFFINVRPTEDSWRSRPFFASGCGSAVTAPILEDAVRVEAFQFHAKSRRDASSYWPGRLRLDARKNLDHDGFCLQVCDCHTVSKLVTDFFGSLHRDASYDDNGWGGERSFGGQAR